MLTDDGFLKKIKRLTYGSILLLLGCLPASAAELLGSVRSDAADRPVSGARVIVFHDLSSVLVQQGRCDRNGNYLFSLEPGPYRIFILKDGYHILKLRTVILHEKETIRLEHGLEPIKLQQTSKSLKQILRNKNGNRMPFRDLRSEPLIDVSHLPQPDNSLVGTVRSRSHQGPDGEATRSATVEFSAWLTDQLRVRSHMTESFHDTWQNDTRHIGAGLQMKWRTLDVDVEAESIKAPGSDDRAESRGFSFGGRFEGDFTSDTRMKVRHSRDHAQVHQELSLEQHVGYQIGDHVIQHDLSVTDWQRDHDSIAHHATLGSTWKRHPDSIIGLAAEVEHIGIEAADHDTVAKTWVTANYRHPNDLFFIDARTGFFDDTQDSGFIQSYGLGAAHGPFRLTLGYEEDQYFQSYTTSDLYGAYTREPLTPYITESFYREQNQVLNARVDMQYSYGWHGRVDWQRTVAVASLLDAYGDHFRQETDHVTEHYGYVLRADRLGSEVEIAHARNESGAHRFDQSEVRYRQSLNPKRNRQFGVFVEVGILHQPHIPGWWLLAELPWEPESATTWYEGNLRLQF